MRGALLPAALDPGAQHTVRRLPRQPSSRHVRLPGLLTRTWVPRSKWHLGGRWGALHKPASWNGGCLPLALEASLWTRLPSGMRVLQPKHPCWAGPRAPPTPWGLQPACAPRAGRGRGACALAWTLGTDSPGGLASLLLPAGLTASSSSSSCPPPRGPTRVCQLSDHTPSRASRSAALGASGGCPFGPVHSTWTSITKCPPQPTDWAVTRVTGTGEPPHTVFQHSEQSFLLDQEQEDESSDHGTSRTPSLGRSAAGVPSASGDLTSSLGTWCEVAVPAGGNHAPSLLSTPSTSQVTPQDTIFRAPTSSSYCLSPQSPWSSDQPRSPPCLHPAGTPFLQGAVA